MKTYRHKNGWYTKQDIEGAYSVYDDKGKYVFVTINEQELLDFGFELEEEKDVYDRCAKKIKKYTERGGDVWQCKIKDIIKEYFPQPTEIVIDMEEYDKYCSNEGLLYSSRYNLEKFLLHKGFKIINE